MSVLFTCEQTVGVASGQQGVLLQMILCPPAAPDLLSLSTFSSNSQKELKNKAAVLIISCL